MPSMDYLSEPNWILVAHLIESINVIRATSLKDLSGAKNQGLIKNGEDLTSSPIHCCTRRTEAFHTSIVLKNQHFSMRRKLNLASSDIRVSSVTRHA